MRKLLVNVLAGVRSLGQHRQRAFLSALGITVGTTAIYLLISIAQGVERDVQKEVESLGVNLLIVVPFRVPEGGAVSFNPNVAGLSYLREHDVQKVRGVPGVRQAVPWLFPGGTLSAGEQESGSTLIIATQPAWFQMRPFEMAEGTVFTEAHSEQRVCVLGSVAKEALFGSSPAVGKSVTVGGEPYRVIGVTAKLSNESLFSFASLDNTAYVPYGYVSTKLEKPPLSRIFIQTEPAVEPPGLVARVEAVLADGIPKENFSVITQRDLLKLLFNVMGIVTSLLAGLTSIALFVGGFGILTVMLMSVGERAKEIGIRKTVGARRSDIFVQFFSEALILAIAGAAMGLLLSYAACLALTAFTKVNPVLSATTVELGFAVSLVVGAVFGIVPALKAAGQDPVVSLRHD